MQDKRKIAKYCKKNNRNCPNCNAKLRIVIHGLVSDAFLNELRENKISFYNAGCCCYGDDRDAAFYCSVCNQKFDRSLKTIKLIFCPRVVDYNIRQEECENEKVLSKKYKIYEKCYCEACKILKNNNDDEYREAAQIIGISDDLIEQVIRKKHSNLRLEKNMLYKNYLCPDEKVIDRLEYWDK